MKHCRSCSVGSRALAHYIHPFNTNTFLLTSPVTEQAATQAACSGIFTIGWIGYYSAHRESLHQLFFPGIKKIDFPVQLLMLGVRGAAETAEIKALFQNNPNIIINTPQTIDWQNEDSIYTYIRQFDVGISPLLDNEFNRCKSAFKLKQCMVCGVPVLGSSIGENNVFIRHGANGFFCDSPDEYLEKITLIKNISGQHYSSMRQSALATYPSFSIDHYCTAFILHYKSSHQQGVRQYANYEGMKIPAPMS